MHDKQAMISLCIFVFLSHLHKLRYNTFIWSFFVLVRFSHYSSSSWFLYILIFFFHFLLLWPLLIFYNLLFICRCSSFSLYISTYLQFTNSAGSSISNRKCSNHMKDHPFIIAYSYLYNNQTKIKTSQIYTKLATVQSSGAVSTIVFYRDTVYARAHAQWVQSYTKCHRGMPQMPNRMENTTQSIMF